MSCLPSVTVLAGFGVWPKENNAAATPLFLGAKPGRRSSDHPHIFSASPTLCQPVTVARRGAPRPPRRRAVCVPPVSVSGRRHRTSACSCALHLRGSSRSFVNSLHQPVDDAILALPSTELCSSGVVYVIVSSLGGPHLRAGQIAYVVRGAETGGHARRYGATAHRMSCHLLRASICMHAHARSTLLEVIAGDDDPASRRHR